ncbi:MAG: M61 family metallopeptidase [Glaciimonas sp.]|nr:M61 family metallopeptidase [Glaciimonas sp.]
MKIELRSAISYRIVPSDPAAHLFSVVLTVPAPNVQGQVLSLPAWIPGSYMMREFSRNIVQIRADAGGKRVALRKLDKHSWQAAACTGPLTVHYDVYAWDPSVRAAHLDQTHGFFNGSSVFLCVLGQEATQHTVDIVCPRGDGYADWRVATGLPELNAQRYGFGSYVADDYDALIDHPVEMGTFVLATFKAHGVPHDIVISGQVPNLDLARLAADLKKICSAQIALFDPERKRAPMPRYVFLTMALGDGYGGLEHRASTALICARADLPSTAAPQEMSDGYRSFLGLCSHEYFHTWNVKRIKPAAFAPYDLRVENYTSLLWLFEGFTSYYDDLMLLRSGAIDQPAYLKLVAKTINNVLRGSGRSKQSVAESSFDAWSKYYRQDENAPNAIVSYYTKGALIALALDLTIRTETKGKKSLDDVMRALWLRYGQDFYPRGKQAGKLTGIAEQEGEAIFDEISGLKLKRFFERYVRGTEDLPLAKLLAPFGVSLKDGRHDGKPDLGLRSVRNGSFCKIANVYEGGAAHQGGLSAGDLLLALDGVRVTATNLDALLSRYRVGDAIVLHAYRGDILMAFDVTLASDSVPQWSLLAESKPLTIARKRAAWLQPVLD